MADIRCPMCSRPNPEDRDTCEFCGARLKPLTNELASANAEPIHPGEEPTPKSTSELEKALPEWLRNIRKREAEQAETPAAEAAGKDQAGSDEDFYKSLSALGAESGDLEARPSEPAPEAEQPADDLLSRLAGLAGPKPEPPAAAGPSEPPGEDLLAGLSALRAASEPTATEEPVDWLAGLSSAQGGEEEETPDWLKGITAKTQPETPPAAETPGGGADWRTQLEQGEKAAAAPPPQPEPEWKGFLGETEQPAANLPEQPEESAESLDWLRDLEAQSGGTPPPIPSEPVAAEPTAAQAPEKDEGLPDWVKLAGAGAAMAAAGKEEPAPADETPEWLNGLQAGAGEPPAGETPAPAEAGELPDWLKTTTGAAAAATLHGGQPTGPEDQTPDWLKDLEAGAPAAQTQAAGEQEVPDWLKAARAEGATFEAPKPEPAAEAGEAGVPDWLKAVGAEAAISETANPEPAAAAEEKPAEAGEPGVPDWLKAATLAGATMKMAKPEEPATPAAPEEAAPEKVEAEPAQGTPDWVKGLAAGAAIGAVHEAGEPAEEELFPATLPDWLSDIKPAEEAAAPAALPPGEGPIEQAELPSWVQAMRPVEAAAGATAAVEEEEFTEAKGPLTGFSNVLPASAGVAGVRKVSAYPNKLVVNESQHGQMELLERLVAGERTAKKPGVRARISTNRMLRWGIAALLLAFVLLTIILQTHMTPTGKLLPPPLSAAIKAVNDLPAGSTVLVVVDYQPALSAELESAATPLLDQLRIKGTDVVFISSTATGSALADRLVAGVDADLGQAAEQHYTNLGYLTGGASGITSFVTNPAGTAPQTISGAPAWEQPPLQDIRSLSGFSAMVVLTDSSDTGAMWIEQSRTLLGSAPLLMVLSAQAEPMLQPYYDSGQVQGMVTGLPGGVAYEQANGIPSIGSHYWDPFSVGFLVADFIVAVGGVMALFMAWQSRRTRPVSEAQ